jgi:hypothetical protein
MVSRKNVGVGGGKERDDPCIQDKLCFDVALLFGPEKNCKALRWVWEMKGNGRELWDQAERWECLRPTDMGKWQACSRRLVSWTGGFLG